MNLQVVVFPEPDGPTNVTKLPLSMAREMSFTAKLRPPSKDFDTQLSSISAVSVIKRYQGRAPFRVSEFALLR
jgi:hypothetical protein